MASAKGKAAFEYMMNYMKKNGKAVYADAAAAAKKAGHTIYPIMWGRAQALLGRVKMKPRKARATRAAAPARREGYSATGKRLGRPPGTGRRVATTNGSPSIEVVTNLANAQAFIDALNSGRRAALRYLNGTWTITAE